MASKKQKYIIGIDEVGRGALAGNVTVAAVALPRKFQITNSSAKGGSASGGKLQTNSKLKLRDSKKLTPKQREIWFKLIKKELFLPYTVASVSPKTVDKINISKAANLAATKALNRLVKNYGLKTANYKIFLDGNLFLNKNLIRINQRNPHKSASTIIKGDEKIPAISLASIVAKVSRDKQMKNLHKKYPQYGFEKHKGYGTKEHFKAIRKHGPSKIHRLTFLKKMR